MRKFVHSDSGKTTTPHADVDRARAGRYHEEATRGLLMPKSTGLPLLIPALLAALALADEPAPALRRPVALALADGGKQLLVANRDGGSVTTIDTRTLKPTAETR